ncbi:MAG: hypothetical protein EPN38_08745 [Rhodanobacteraceae bacterium]|nr:MAG: hypothetical protein EPN38_08745 [Rhodanobacteraceae bacterium]
MSIIHVNQIAARIAPQFEPSIVSNGALHSTPVDAAKPLLTRCLAAYAIQYKTACSDADAGAAVVDGSNDNGIDAIYVNQGNGVVVMAQSKWMSDGTGEPSSADIGKFCRGVEDVLSFEWDRFNAAIQAKRTEVESVINSFDAHVELVLIYTGSQDLAVHGKRQLDDLLTKLNDSSELVSLTILNQAAVHASLAAGSAGAPVVLEFGLANWGRVDEPLNAYYGTVTGSELAAWWSTNGVRLFDRNLRSVLGRTEVNQEITSTAIKRPRDFWYFNNGVTVVANRVTKNLAGGASRDFGTFRADGASVVNGAQTVSTLGRAAASGANLDDVRVLLRVISLENDSANTDYSAEITRTNNTQNRIEARDFATQDPEQTRLMRELAMDGITYAVVRSEETSATEDFIGLPDATVALACARADPSLAVLAKRNIGQFWSDISKSPYKTIFNPSTSGARLARSVRVVRMVEQRLRKHIGDLPKKSGKRYGILVHGNRLIESLVFKQIGGSALDASHFDIAPFGIDAKVDGIVDKVVDVIDTTYGDNFMATLFKNTDKCTYIFAHVV